jgi:hypothetical protein
LIVITFAALIVTQQRGAPSPCAARKRVSAAAPRAAAAAAGAGAFSSLCQQPPMKLAIYQGKWWHSEVFGIFIDHARECGHSLVIYYDEGHATSAVPLYKRLYAGGFEVRPLGEFMPQERVYDAVIFTTPDDIPDEGMQKRNAHRYVYTIHLLEPAYAKNWHVLRIHMSTVVAWPFVVPVYDGGDSPPPAAARGKEIMMLGTLWDGDNYDIKQVYEFAKLLKPHGWTLVAYTRHWGSSKGEVPPPPDNMRLELSKGTEEVRASPPRPNEKATPLTSPPPSPTPPSQVFDYAKKVSFIIIWPSANSWYVVDRLTGSLPFAMSVGTPVLTSSAFASVYNLHEGRGALVAPDVAGLAEELVGKDGAGAPKLTAQRHQALIDTVYSYREEVRKQNTRTLDSLFSAIPGGTQRQPLALPNPLTRFYK